MSVHEQQQDVETSPASKSTINGRDTLQWFIPRVFIPAVILLVLWQLIANLTGINLVDVFNAIMRLTFEGDSQGIYMSDHIFASVTRVSLGFLAAALTGIPLGIIIGRYRLVDSVLGPVVEAMRPIPPIAWIPLSLLMFPGNIIGAQAFIIWVGAFFPILINTTTGVKRTEPVHIDSAKTLGANERQILSKIVLPSAAPEIFAGLRIGFGIGWMCLVAAEMLRGRVGLGFLIWTYWALGRTAEVITGMLFIGLIGFLITLAFLLIEKYLLRWRQSVSV
ncbi:ABC transporter permease [Candidatus Thorarchaeota archaeon]|nr:ABC transporter permease [Candidatus Thorarchaeota archaeon]TFG95820.1 MAG: ABC transporter permease [Candidatus Thorarchaeota archaeon]